MVGGAEAELLASATPPPPASRAIATVAIAPVVPIRRIGAGNLAVMRMGDPSFAVVQA
jgi:hypothetical protein